MINIIATAVVTGVTPAVVVVVATFAAGYEPAVTETGINWIFK